MLFTVEIQTGRSGMWRALHSAVTVTGRPGVTAAEVALSAATNQDIAEGTEGWRVCVWKGADADTHVRPTAIVNAKDVA